MTLDYEKHKNLYVHFPFCETKCHYCDFFSLPESKYDLGIQHSIYNDIIAELNLYADKLSTLETVFLGGGTPSLVESVFLEKLLSQLTLSNDTEITLEANPSSVSLKAAKAWKNACVNRVSLGVQALDDERLKWLGRVHSKTQVYKALESIFCADIKHVSIDYIVGVPKQTTQQIEKELALLFDFFPQLEHVSAYLLTLHQSNPKYSELPSDNIQLEHLKVVSTLLREQGFEHYEISNFAKPSCRARHNENYWLGGSYLGIGPSAHSFWKSLQKRNKNWASLHRYAEQIQKGTPPIEWEEVLSLEQQRLEYLMLRLRRKDGLNLEEYESLFKFNFYNKNYSTLLRLVEKGLCEMGSNLKLTENGFFLCDQILRGLA